MTMGLPESYFTYPHRGYGMDHDWYEWSMLPRRAAVEWPDGARIALWVTVALEFFPLDQPAEPFKAPGGMVTPYPDLRHYTLRDYGNRVGVFRVFKILDELGITPSVAFNSKVSERYPHLMAEVVRRDWEVLANGVDMGRLHYGGLARDAEAELVDESFGVLREMSGQPVGGWWSPARSESMNTLELVAERGGRYVCDWYNDDMPYPITTAGGPLYSMPLSHELDDQTIQVQYHQTEAEFAEQLGDGLRVLYDESAEQGGRILSIVIHPWVSGQPHRIKALARALRAIVDHDAVWSASGTQILDVFESQQ
jgi:peptidoglycan/xylan/chitin deacetylase (PgdA/CDA1 family)